VPPSPPDALSLLSAQVVEQSALIANLTNVMAVMQANITSVPVYTSANGSVLVQSAFGGDVVFAPSAGGAC
jgi:hypothetical protein